MAVTDWSSPIYPGIYNTEFTAYANAFVSNDTYATGVENDYQDYEYFGFTLPSGSTITKVEVKLEHKQTSGGLISSSLSLYSGNSNNLYSTGDTEPIAGSTEGVDIVEFTSLGGLTDAQINSSEFGVTIQLIPGGGATSTYSLDSIQMRISYIKSPTISTYYFDGSDEAANVTAGSFSNITNVDDGSTRTATTSSSNGGAAIVGGTNAPSSGGNITRVRARLFGGYGGPISCNAVIYTNGKSEELGTAPCDRSISVSSPDWASYVTLSAPTGGWTWPALQALEAEINVSTLFSAGSIEVYRIEIEVESENLHYPLPSFRPSY